MFRFFQMDLSVKFKMITSSQQTKITFLRIDTPYRIERAERVQTKYGQAIVATTTIPTDIRESVSTQTLRVYR